MFHSDCNCIQINSKPTSRQFVSKFKILVKVKDMILRHIKWKKISLLRKEEDFSVTKYTQNIKKIQNREKSTDNISLFCRKFITIHRQVLRHSSPLNH